MTDITDKTKEISQNALRLHGLYQGKMQTMPKCPVRDLSDFSLWYTPGVAEPCRAIHADPQSVDEYTNRGNTVAIVSDGTRILGLGDIGPRAGLPVMEGKALLFKYLGGVDAVPLCLGTKDPDELVRTVQLLEPSFGGINLEDIAQPKCFHVLDSLRNSMGIPVWHDDQQGTATVVVAALTNALKLVDKAIDEVRIAMIGMGAANVATYRLLCHLGIEEQALVACDSRGTLHGGRNDIAKLRRQFADKWHICTQTNRENIVGGIAEALHGADVCIAFSSGGIIKAQWIEAMADEAIVFACANPVPEIWPEEAKRAGARIVATGRGDFPNQVNNSLVFPGMFRGVLDAGARRISDEMALAAARELAEFAAQRGLTDDNIVPRMDEWQVYPAVAAASAVCAQQQKLARVHKSREEYLEQATRIIRAAREMTHLLMREDAIAPPP